GVVHAANTGVAGRVTVGAPARTVVVQQTVDARALRRAERPRIRAVVIGATLDAAPFLHVTDGQTRPRAIIVTGADLYACVHLADRRRVRTIAVRHTLDAHVLVAMRSVGVGAIRRVIAFDAALPRTRGELAGAGR